MSIQLYLIFNGNCKDAVEFYYMVFNSPLQAIITFGEGHVPNDTSLSEEENLVMHTELTIAGSRIMLSDSSPNQPVTVGGQCKFNDIIKEY